GQIQEDLARQRPDVRLAITQRRDLHHGRNHKEQLFQKRQVEIATLVVAIGHREDETQRLVAVAAAFRQTQKIRKLGLVGRRQQLEIANQKRARNTVVEPV